MLELQEAYRVKYDFGEDFPDEGFWFYGPQLMDSDELIRTSGASIATAIYTEPYNGNNVKSVEILFKGERGFLTKDEAIKKATAYILGWLIDKESNATFTGAEVWRRDPVLAVPSEREDITEQARAIEEGIKRLRDANPSD